jgi:hypothetical protein
MLYTFKDNSNNLFQLLANVFSKGVLLVDPLDSGTDQYYLKGAGLLGYRKAF